jgi:hypothetical protein
MAGLLGYPITEDYAIAPEAKLQNWSPEKEAQFQAGIKQTPWYMEFKKQYGEEPNLNAPEYNYRAAWQSGVRPETYEFDKLQHWPSVNTKGESLKATKHPTAWMEDYMQITGADPHSPVPLSKEQIVAISKALRYRYGK